MAHFVADRPNIRKSSTFEYIRKSECARKQMRKIRMSENWSSSGSSRHDERSIIQTTSVPRVCLFRLIYHPPNLMPRQKRVREGKVGPRAHAQLTVGRRVAARRVCTDVKPCTHAFFAHNTRHTSTVQHCIACAHAL